MKIKFFVFSLSLLLNSYSVAGYAPEQVWDFIKESGGIEGALKVLVEKTAKVLPQKIDSQTEITSVSSILNEVHYNARLITVESNASTLLKKSNHSLRKIAQIIYAPVLFQKYSLPKQGQNIFIIIILRKMNICLTL